jgi:2-polyprenyl-3-methyl-5-hydroxy-6-metoxy-1,4-benzoquinol methylase
MSGHALLWRRRVRGGPAVEIRGRRGRGTFRYALRKPGKYLFTTDLYNFRERAHPTRHLGWWRFDLPAGAHQAALRCDFDPIRRDSLTLDIAGRIIAPVDAWFNPEFVFTPLADLQLAFRDHDDADAIRHLEPMLLKFFDRDILRAFYARQFVSEGYSAPVDEPFLWELHAYKLRQLQRLFRVFIPDRGRVLDVGCGRSIFTELEARLPFEVVAGDLDGESVRSRATQCPEQRWTVFDASTLPFRSGEFDALFAGEVIEHVTDVEAALAEWHRVLKPGGVAIITTPNRDRLVSLADRVERPYSEDHLNELSYRRLTRELLPRAGFEFVTQSCVHLEIVLKNVLTRLGPIDDLLQAELNSSRYRWAMRALFPLGRLFPQVAMALIVVARKVADGAALR